MRDVEGELGLDRTKLVELALLLGSDYTEGVSGIGIVNALEVVRAFPGAEGLKRFRDWVENPDTEALKEALVAAGGGGRGGGRGRKGRAGRAGGGCDEDDDHNELGSPDGGGGGGGGGSNAAAVISAAERAFRRDHRGARRNWQLPSSFPSAAVVDAYVTPRVDRNKSKLTWGKPDMDMLRKFCRCVAWCTCVSTIHEQNKQQTTERTYQPRRCLGVASSTAFL